MVPGSQVEANNNYYVVYKLTLTITSLQVDTMQLCIACNIYMNQNKKRFYAGDRRERREK